MVVSEVDKEAVKVSMLVVSEVEQLLLAVLEVGWAAPLPMAVLVSTVELVSSKGAVAAAASELLGQCQRWCWFRWKKWK